MCFCSQSGGGAGIGLFTEQLLSRDCGRRGVKFVRPALKVFTQVGRDFVGVMLLYRGCVLVAAKLDDFSIF